MTKLWIHPQAPGYSPGATFNGHWEDTTTAETYTRAMGPTKADSRFDWEGGNSPSRAETSASNDWDVCLVRLVSPPLASNVTINGTIEVMGVLQESSAAADFLRHVHVWVTQGDSTTARGKLLDTFIGTEVTTSLLGRGTGSQAVTSVDAQTGDRIVVEYGFRATNSVTTSYTGTARLNGGEDYADVAEGGFPTNMNTFWVDISNALTFTSDVRVTQFSVETAIQQTIDPPTRISQMLVEAAIVPIPPTRLSQMVIEVMVLPPAAAVVFPDMECVEPARYFVNLYDSNGNLVGIIDEPKTFRIEHYLNGYSNCSLPVDDTSTWARLFNLDTIVEIWRRVGSYKYIEYVGMHRTPQRVLSEERHRIFTSYSRGLLDLVRRRSILYKATTKYTLKGGPGETVIKEIVNENVGSGANNTYELDVNGYNIGRLVAGYTQGFVIAPDQARGWYYAAQNSWTNVLEVIQAISNVTSVDFDVRLTNYKPLEFTFECYYPQLGVDRRNTLKFSPELGNMAEPSYTYSRTEESNVIAVLGQGEGVHRRTLVQLSGAVNDSPWNRVESTADASGKDRYQDYVSSGQAALKERAAVESFEYKILQTSTAQYGIHYKVGDIATFEYSTISRVKKIVGAVIDCSDGVETIAVNVGDIPVKPT